MSFLGKLLGLKPVDERPWICEQMSLMMSQTEEVYRNQVGVYVEETGPAAPSGRGIFKARFFAGCFMAYAFRVRSQQLEGAEEMFSVAAGMAVEPLLHPMADPHLDRDDAVAFATRFGVRTLGAICEEFRDGPSTIGHETAGYEELAEIYHDALADSIGYDRYDCAVRQRFDHFARQAVFAALRLTVDVIAEK